MLRKCDHEYGQDAITQHTFVSNNRVIGDLVEFTGPLGYSHRVILTEAMRPYSNGSFATREGALNYLKLIATTLKNGS